MGISRPWIVRESRLVDEFIDPDAALGSASGIGAYGGGYGEGEFSARPSTTTTDGEESEQIKLRRYNFVIQFCWKPTTRTMRREIAEQRRIAEEQRRAEEALAEEEAEF